LRRTVTKKGKKTIEVVYLIASAEVRTADPATLAAWVRGHWHIGRVGPPHCCYEITPEFPESFVSSPAAGPGRSDPFG
jgi:hypothetical protein